MVKGERRNSALAGRAASITAALVATGSLLAGCGSDSDSGSAPSWDERQIGLLTERFEAALRKRDTESFCRLLAPNDVLKLGEGKTKGRERCLRVWSVGRNPLFRATEADLAIEDLSFKGRYATAELASGGKLAYAWEGGRWYVHLAPAREQLR